MNSYLDSNELVIQLESSITSENAEAVGTEIRQALSAHPDVPLCLDAEHLSYISSAGLRLIMVLQKSLSQPMYLCNVSSDVYSIFDQTGFLSFLDVRKKMRTVSIEGCPSLGEGAFGTVYRLNSEQVVKVFHNGKDSLPIIREEQSRSRKAFLKGIPTAIPFDIVRVGEQYGAVYELINAQNCNAELCDDPSILPELTDHFARFLKELHALNISPGELREAKSVYLDYLEKVSCALSEGCRQRLRSLIESVPTELHVLHGDVQLKNVMDCNGEYVLIDMDTLCTGNPVFEFSGLYLSYIAFNEDNPHDTEVFMGIDAETASRIFYRTLDAYLGHPSPEALKEAVEKIRIPGYLRFLYVLIVEGADIHTELKETQIRHAAAHLDDLTQRIDAIAL